VTVGADEKIGGADLACRYVEEDLQSAVIPAEAEGVTGWIEQHSDVLLRLMLCHSRPESDCLSDSRIEVADLEVEVHHRPLGTVYRRPNGSSVVSCLLENDVDGPLGRSEDGGSWFLVTDGPAEQF